MTEIYHISRSFASAEDAKAFLCTLGDQEKYVIVSTPIDTTPGQFAPPGSPHVYAVLQPEWLVP